MRKRRRQRRLWGAIFVLTSSMLAYLLAFLAQVVLEIGDDNPLEVQLLIGLAGLTGSAVYSVIQEIRIIRQFEKDLREANKPALESLLTIACRYISSDKTIRACVFLLNDDDELRMFVNTEGFTRDERYLRFTRSQGFVGDIFWKRPQPQDPRYINLEGISEEDLIDKWKLSPEQRNITKDIKHILAVNLYSNGTSIGVLAFDSRSLISSDGAYLKRPSAVNKALEAARLVEELL